MKVQINQVQFSSNLNAELIRIVEKEWDNVMEMRKKIVEAFARDHSRSFR